MLLAKAVLFAFMWGSQPSLFGSYHLFSYAHCGRKFQSFVFLKQKAYPGIDFSFFFLLKTNETEL